jgi:Predicted protease with the C-terminal PDZ domain
MKRKIWLITGVSAAVITAALLGGWLWNTNEVRNMDRDVSRFSVEYRVKPENVAGKLLSVSVRLKPEYLSPQKTLYLNKEEVDTSKPLCVDQSGNSVVVTDLNEVWEIGPLEDGVSDVDFSYSVKLGESSGDESRTVGELYSDLLVFQGKNVLMLPWLDSGNMQHPEKYITGLSFQLTGEESWNAIIPFGKINGGEKSFRLDHPTWYDFYDIGNSSFCFGGFEPLKVSTGAAEATFYLDRAAKNSSDTYDLSVLLAFYQFYAEKFGEGLGDYPFVLLRSTENGNVILGGVGGRSTALSLSMPDPDACQTMSRTLYHAFFDSKVTARNLRYQPNLWLYNGLADYYVQASADMLTPQLKQIYGIEPQDDMKKKYLRYLYFSLTDPIMMALSPDQEGNMPAAQETFYYETKVPLLLHTLENFTEQNGEGSILRRLAQQRPREDLEVSEFMKEVLGGNEPVLRQYISGASFIPNYWGLSGNSMSREEIVSELSLCEDAIADSYQQENIAYPKDTFELIDPDTLKKEISGRNLSFASKEVEKIVWEYSDTLYLLLMQNALRADICGIQDPGELASKTAFHTKANEQKWLDYVKKVA